MCYDMYTLEKKASADPKLRSLTTFLNKMFFYQRLEDVAALEKILGRLWFQPLLSNLCQLSNLNCQKNTTLNKSLLKVSQDLLIHLV